MVRGFRTISLLSAVLLTCGLMASPVLAKSGGKKPIGEIVSFDESSMTLVIEMKSGSELEAEVADDAKIKLEHRGDHSTGKGHGNPTKGSLEDLVEGAKVLRLKLDKHEGVVSKIRLRPAPEECEADDTEDEEADEEESNEDESDDGSDEEESDDEESDDGEEDTDETEETDCEDSDQSDDETDECETEDDSDDESDGTEDDGDEEESDDGEDDTDDDTDEDGSGKGKNKSKGKKKNKGEEEESEC